jgi:site-specific DNA-methyltransferase (adenine-specific)
VLDPFLGVGSTLLAAQRLGYRGIGVEIDPGYADAAAWHLRERLI